MNAIRRFVGGAKMVGIAVDAGGDFFLSPRKMGDGRQHCGDRIAGAKPHEDESRWSRFQNPINHRPGHGQPKKKKEGGPSATPEPPPAGTTSA